MKLQIFKVKNPKKFDIALLSILLIMATTSILAIYSAFHLITLKNGPELILKQLLWYGIGFIALSIIMYIGNDSIYDFAKIAYWILLGCLLYLFINKAIINRLFGLGTNLPFVYKVNGATSWFNFPGIGSFQPSEFMKVVLIIITAKIIDTHNKNKIFHSFQSDIDLFIKIGKWVLPPLILTFLQPDTGIVIITIISISVMILCSGIRKEWIIIAGGTIAFSLVVFFFLYFFHFDFLSSLFGSDGIYKLNRITGWLNPEADIRNTGNQLYTALLALGSAGLIGHGIQVDIIQIPEAQTDFIFAVFGQSFGFLGTLFILLLCLILDLKLCRIAMLSKNSFEKYFICGILGMLLFQQVQNIGMVVGLLPITGITLPMISYGGSSLLSYLIAFGIIMNISAKARKLSDFVY